MPLFYYKARNDKGELITGEIDSKSSDRLQEDLFSEGLIPISVKEIKSGGLSFQLLSDFFGKVKAEELMIFTRQFYTLFRAGVSMDTILGTLSKQASSRKLKSVLEKIRTDIAGGASLSQAFGRHPKVFNELYVSMLSAGEEAGILDNVLYGLVKLMEKEDEIKRSIKTATLYPKIVITVLIGAVVVLMSFVVPKFTSFYGHYRAELPIATQILISTSNFIRGYWYIALVIMIIFVYLYKKYAASKTGRYKIDRLKLKLPVFGQLSVKIANSRFGHILGALYSSGLSMPHSLEVVSNVIGNEAYALEVRKLKDAIQKGSTLSDAMVSLNYFSPVMIETTAIGEKSGALDEMLTAIADHYELEVSHNIKNMTTLLEPLLLVAIFCVVTVMALAIFLPIWNMSSIIK